MQTQSKRLEQSRHYRELELIPVDLYLKQTEPQKKTEWLKAIARCLVDWMTPSTEPRIHHKVAANGLAYWKVFDPISGETARFNNVEDVHIWLEQRYCCPGAMRSHPSSYLESIRSYPFRF